MTADAYLHSPPVLMRRLAALLVSDDYAVASRRGRRRMRYRVCIQYHAQMRALGWTPLATWADCIRELERVGLIIRLPVKRHPWEQP